jgi:aromatic ring-opening dioxygenase catalytic subunit (LigB family)
MPLGLGLACSHSSVLYRPRDQWEKIYKQLIGKVEQPLRSQVETPQVLDQYSERIEAGFAGLKKQLDNYKPNAIIMVVCDQYRTFDESHTPQLHVHVGPDIWGSTRYSDLGEKEAKSAQVTIPCHEELADWLVNELVWEGFDMNQSRGVYKPLGDPDGGVTHTLTDPLLKLTPKLDIPIVALHVNGHVDPAISGHRVVPLGQAIARVMAERPERIAILASGGLTGDPRGYIAGWIDETLDNWILARFRRGRSAELATLWDLDSNTVRGATREVRNWIAVGAAMETVGAKAEVLDYIRLHHATVGTAFASWDPQRTAPTAVARATVAG